MPQIVKGGKYVYGWSRVGDTGRIVIPHEAVEEYNLTICTEVILLPGSKRSGGFGLTTGELLYHSPLAFIADTLLVDFHTEGEVIEIKRNPYCWVQIHEESITVPVETLKRYEISPGDYVLSVRSSNIAIGFPVKGPIINEAKNHAEIKVFG